MVQTSLRGFLAAYNMRIFQFGADQTELLPWYIFMNMSMVNILTHLDTGYDRSNLYNPDPQFRKAKEKMWIEGFNTKYKELNRKT